MHAADAYYRVSHKLAVVNVHLSPGLTNALTGVASAAMDGTPMVVITGNTPSYHHAREAHQSIRLHADASQGDIFKPICKRVWRVDDAKFLPDVMPRALNIAQTGRPGAVLLDVPMDVFSQHDRGRGRRRWPRRPNLPALGRPTPTGIAARRRDAVGRQAPGDLRRQRRRRCRAPPPNWRRWRDAAAGAGGHHPDGQGRLPRERPAVGRHHRHLGHARGQRHHAAPPT